MRTMKNVYTTIILAMLFSIQLNAQQISINGLGVEPANPTANDNILVKCDTWFVGAPCPTISSSFAVQGNHVYAVASHDVTPKSAVCNSLDTIHIGQLPMGTYMLVYKMININTNDTAVDSLSFQVSMFTSSENVADVTPRIYVHPNPSWGAINISYSGISREADLDISIYDITGRRAWRSQESLTGSSSVTICPSLRAGVYFVEGNYHGKTIAREKLVRY